MLTWILIAIIVAALFGLINLDQIREKLIAAWKKYWPEAQKYLDQAKTKIEENKNKEDE